MVDHCPVCGSEGAYLELRPDKKQGVQCPRCGDYVIDKASEYWTSRAQVYKQNSARASHAIAKMTAMQNDDPVEITSPQFVRLIGQPLPNRKQQISNLLEWLAAYEPIQGEPLELSETPGTTIARLTAIMGAQDTQDALATIWEARQNNDITVITTTPSRFEISSDETIGRVPIDFPDTLEPELAQDPDDPYSVGPATDQLRADPSLRIRLSDQQTVPNAVRVRHDASRERLRELKEVLDGLHGIDASDVSPTVNTRPAPFNEEDLQLLKSVVNSAIELHTPTAIPTQIQDALSAIGQYLEQVNDILDKAGDTAEATKELAIKLAAAAAAIAGLVAMLKTIAS